MYCHVIPNFNLIIYEKANNVSPDPGYNNGRIRSGMD